MNKRKVAVFVEGQTELVFVRDFLRQWYGYDEEILGFDCVTLFGETTRYVPFSCGNTESQNYYLLVNVGNDRSVLSKMLKRMASLQERGYQLVIGLRDMYSREYRELCGSHTIDDDLIEDFKNAVHKQIEDAGGTGFLDLHFAIMEVEAWFLGMSRFLLEIDCSLTPDFILEHTGTDVNQDPERAFFHPAAELLEIYQCVGKDYEKHLSDISAITAALTDDDYLNLFASDRCASFKTFAEVLLNCHF